VTDTAIHLPWKRIVELAQSVEATYEAQGQVDSEAVLRLARAVLQFQEQLLGGMVRTRPR
jgi:hypothetical protein